MSLIGSAAEAQTPPASAPLSVSGSDALAGRFDRRLAQQRGLAELALYALSAPALDPLLAEAAALIRRFRAVPGAADFGGDDEELAFLEAVTEVIEAAGTTFRALAASRHAALHDVLTGLANRSLIVDHLGLALARAARRSSLTAVVFLDLDDFKRINDTLGHAAGDELLVRVAERLSDAVRPTDTLGRWGGDEFVAVCDDVEKVTDVPAIVERVAAAFELPFHVAGAELSVAASIGVAISGGTHDPAALIAAADTDMYRAKADHGARRRPRPAEAVMAPGLLPPKHERLTGRLLELLSLLSDADLRVDPDAVATG